MSSPAGRTIHPLIAPFPVGASVGAVHSGGLRSEKHGDKTVEETGSEGDDCHRDDLIAQVGLSLRALGGLALKQTGDKLSQWGISNNAELVWLWGKQTCGRVGAE